MYAVRTEMLQRLCILINNKIFVVELSVIDTVFYTNNFDWDFLCPLKWTGSILKFSVHKIIIFLRFEICIFFKPFKTYGSFLWILPLRNNEPLLHFFLKTQICCAVVNWSFIFHSCFFFPLQRHSWSSVSWTTSNEVEKKQALQTENCQNKSH